MGGSGVGCVVQIGFSVTGEDRTHKKRTGRGDGGENQCGVKGRAQNEALTVIQSLSSFLTLDKVIGPCFFDCKMDDLMTSRVFFTN